jgi:hypothetical protein
MDHVVSREQPAVEDVVVVHDDDAFVLGNPTEIEGRGGVRHVDGSVHVTSRRLT